MNTQRILLIINPDDVLCCAGSLKVKGTRADTSQSSCDLPEGLQTYTKPTAEVVCTVYTASHSVISIITCSSVQCDSAANNFTIIRRVVKKLFIRTAIAHRSTLKYNQEKVALVAQLLLLQPRERYCSG